MSLLSVAQSEASFNIASNLDTAATEFVKKVGSSATNQGYGVLTQSSDSLTGNASYYFGSNGRVQYNGATGGSGGFANYVQEFIFKKSTKPATGTQQYLSTLPTSQSGGSVNTISVDADGYINTYIKGASLNLFFTGSTNLCDDKWHHVVLYYGDGANQHRLYVDGTLIASGSTNGNTVTSNIWNVGSYLSYDFTTSGASFEGKIDFAALYTGVNYSTTGMDSFVANHMAEFANRVLAAAPLTASALAVEPVITTTKQVSYAASPATASSLFANATQSARDGFTLLDTYMKTLSLEQWYSFNEPKAITNLGTGGNPGFIYHGTAFNDESAGIQGSGALRITGTTNTSYVSATIDANINPEITDGDFSIGFWVKKATAESAIIFSTNDEDLEFFNVEFNSSGYIRTNAHLNNQDHAIETTTSYADGNWHYVAIRKSGNTMQMWVDNVSKGTVTVAQSFASQLHGDFGTGGGTNSQLMYVSQFYIATATAVTSTQITNIWTYGQALVQGGAAMVMPKFSRDNAFNLFVQSKSPHLYFKMDNATGLPQNAGSDTVTLSAIDSSYTQDISSPNYKAFNFTDRNTQLTGAWSTSTGTYSIDNAQTILMYAKMTYAANNYIGGSAGFGSTTGGGLLLQHLASGLVRVRASDADYIESVSSTSYVDDGNYHMIVAVKDGSNLNLYIDGKLEGSSTSSLVTLTDSGQTSIGGAPGLIPPSGARNLTVDEFAVFETAFSAEEVFNAYQSIALIQDTTATALMVQPTTSLGFGPMINAAVSSATALLVDPTQLDTIAPIIAVMTADAMFQVPNYAATKNTNNAASPMTASAQGENPGVAGNGNIVALHMDGTASFPAAYARIPGTWNADPSTVSAEMIQPGFATTKGALIKPQSLNASAQLPLPPAYFTITDDRWYQRLLLVDYQSSDFNGVTTFFNTSTDIVRGGSYQDWAARDQRNVFNAYYGYNLTDSPLPVAYAGTYDTQNRKALRIRNIALTTSDGYANTGANWTFETYIKTTKKNQILFVGKRLGDRSNPNYQDINAAWRLRDGKISLNNTKSLKEGWPNSFDSAAFTGFKDIADGEWHHIIIQNRSSDRRTQIFIDGELDIQRYGYDAYAIHQVGYNSSDVNSYSDFETSAVASNQGSFVLERETHLNYFAAVGIIPVEAPVATASATLTADNKGRGNRGRALMLYFWPTFNVNSGSYMEYFRGISNNYGNGFTSLDQGVYGSDPDTFYNLTTWIGNGANKFYDWDLWPLAVAGPPTGDDFPADTHPILKDGVIDTQLGGYRDPVTNNPRYINLMEDLKDLSQFDMICFRNYPDESNERDSYGTSAKGVTDPYFNILDKDLFEEFLVSLREAVDSGISLLVTNPQLAVDMGFIDTYHTVSALDGAGNQTYSDEYTPIKLKDPLATGSPVLNIDYPTVLTQPGRTNAYSDYYRNNYHQVVNTIPGLTDDPAYIWKDEVYYKPDGLEYAELDRSWSHIEYNAGLQSGDRFLISSMINAKAYYAVPMNSIKAGKAITKFADTYYHGSVERVNPYRDYATTIAIEPGTVVNGKQIGAKVFISFTDNVGNQKSATPSYLNPGSNYPIETRLVELKSDYWIDYAFSTGTIDEAERDAYKAYLDNIDRQYPNGGATADAEKYWTLNGQNILGQANGFDGGDVGIDTAESVKTGKKVAKTRAGMRRRNTVSTSDRPSYGIVSSWKFPIISVPIPNINTRGLWWLSERIAYDTLPQRPVVLEADAFMPQPVVSGYKIASVNAQAALASATIVETDLRSGTLSINSAPLPMMATAQLVPLGLSINPGVATATARITTNSRTITSEDDDVVLYILHEDPILYIREDAIK